MKVVKKGKTCKKSEEVSWRLIKGPCVCAKSFLNAMESPERERPDQIWLCKRSLWLHHERVLEETSLRQGDRLGGSGCGQMGGWRPEGLCRDEKCSGDKVKELGTQFHLGGRGKKWRCLGFSPVSGLDDELLFRFSRK